MSSERCITFLFKALALCASCLCTSPPFSKGLKKKDGDSSEAISGGRGSAQGGCSGSWRRAGLAAPGRRCSHYNVFVSVLVVVFPSTNIPKNCSAFGLCGFEWLTGFSFLVRRKLQSSIRANCPLKRQFLIPGKEREAFQARKLQITWNSIFLTVTLYIKVIFSERVHGQRGFPIFLWHLRSTFDAWLSGGSSWGCARKWQCPVRTEKGRSSSSGHGGITSQAAGLPSWLSHQNHCAQGRHSAYGHF